MTGNEYQKAALRTANMNYSEYSMIINGALGLCGEAGEVADIIKKATFQGHKLDTEHIAEELGDVAWKRYPEGFDCERSVHRPEYEGGACHD